MIDKLELLLALARERHFGHAAEAAGVTQPTLSAAVKSLEDQFGILIVERGSRFRGFTPEGEKILDWARRLVGDAHAMREEIRALKRGLTGELRLGVIPTALPVMADLILPFASRYEDVTISVLSLNSNVILTRIDNLETDVGISYIDTEPLGRYETIPLYEEHYALLVSPESSLSGRESVTWAEAGGVALALLTPDMQNRRLIDQHLADAGAKPRKTLESNSITLLHAHVETGQWASIFPVRLAESLAWPNRLKAIPLVDPTVTHGVGLILNKRPAHTPQVTAFVVIARTAVRQGPAMH